LNGAALADALRLRAKELGFDACGFTDARLPERAGRRLMQFVGEGRHGDMTWMADTLDRRKSPDNIWPEARTAVVVAMNYGPDSDPLQRLQDHGLGNISVYALGRDYHDVVKGRLKHLAQWLARETNSAVKVFVDTAPLMEKPLAEAAGIGWQGKHTNLVSRQLGSWFFLGVILTQAEMPRDAEYQDRCGTCSACLAICPTKAFPAPYQLDARRCISYLTIEHKGHIGREFRAAMGNRIFGCDDCLAVCPWNKFAKAAREAKLQARHEIQELRLAHLLAIDDAAFRRLFAGSPVRRTGRNRFTRNVLIAAGNSKDTSLVPAIKLLLGDASPLVRAMAVWALSQLDPHDFAGERSQRMASERDKDVRREWESGSG
jgi:epoxyqueuosine reductase